MGKKVSSGGLSPSRDVDGVLNNCVDKSAGSVEGVG